MEPVRVRRLGARYARSEPPRHVPTRILSGGGGAVCSPRDAVRVWRATARRVQELGSALMRPSVLMDEPAEPVAATNRGLMSRGEGIEPSKRAVATPCWVW